MASNWGPVEHPMEHNHVPNDGPEVCLGTPENEINEYKRFDETNSSQDDMCGWKKVDHCSGPAGADGNALHHFEDGPAGWKQT